jgi:hypothetical protein
MWRRGDESGFPARLPSGQGRTHAAARPVRVEDMNRAIANEEAGDDRSRHECAGQALSVGTIQACQAPFVTLW